MQHWRVRPGNGPRPDYLALIDGMDIMLGTSAHGGECIGLRRCDVDMTVSPPTVLIGGTIVQTKEQGIHRKNSPKRTRQRRRVALPALSAGVVRRRLALAGRGKEALLFATKNGNPISVSNYERLLRSFVDDNQDALEELGVEVDQYSTHIYRRTTATLVERAAGLTLASRLLGMRTSRSREPATSSAPRRSIPSRLTCSMSCWGTEREHDDPWACSEPRSKVETVNTLLPSPRSVLNTHRDELVRVLKQFHVTRAGVFGSTARGEDVQGSDIDLIVDFAPDAERDLIGLSEHLSATAGVPVDVVDARAVHRRARETGIGTTILRETVPL